MTTNKESLLLQIEKKRSQLNRLKGAKRLGATHSLIDLAKQHSVETAREIIDDFLAKAEMIPCEEAALLLGEKAFLSFQQAAWADAEKFANKALRVARTCGSKRGETRALVLKGYVEDVRGQHKRVAAFYTKALQTASRFERPGIMMDLGTSLSKAGDYAPAIERLEEALRLSKQLMGDSTISNDLRLTQRRIHVEAWSRLGVVNESIGDYDAAEGAYDRALKLAAQSGFVPEQYKALSRKFKLLLFRGNLQEAERSLRTIEHLPLPESDARTPVYIANDWARFYRAAGRYEEALKKYRETLWVNGDGQDQKLKAKHLHEFMQNQVDLFQEMLVGIRECLIGLERGSLAERVTDAATEYDQTVSGVGIYKEIDKKVGIARQWKRFQQLLADVFDQSPEVVRYRHLTVTMRLGDRRATVEGAEQLLTINRRAFLILKLLVDANGECVTGDDIQESWDLHQESAGEAGGVRTYIKRYIREKLRLSEFLKDCPNRKGWRLLPEK